MSSSSPDSQLTSALCQSVAATKSDFYTECRLPNWSHDSYRFTVLLEIEVRLSFYKKSDSIYSICFIVYNNRETI